MDPAIQAFKDKMAEKADAKAKVMAAVGKEDWATVEEYGVNGVEGAAMAAAQTLADDYVAAHPEEFVTVRGESFESVVKLITAFKQAGMEEARLKLTMYELATYERQQIGVTASPALRVAGARK